MEFSMFACGCAISSSESDGCGSDDESSSTDSLTDRIERVRDMKAMDERFRKEHPKLLHQFFVGNEDEDRPAVIYDDGTGNCRLISYMNLTYSSRYICGIVTHCLGVTKGFVAVAMKQHLLAPVLIGILRAGCGYYCLDMETGFKEHFHVMKCLNIQFMIAEPEYEDLHPEAKELPRSNNYEIPAARIKFKLFTFVHKRTFQAVPYEWAYAIRTSGTTALRKIVLVSHASIVPNIHDLRERWELTSKDVIFGASPISFDPSIVELFLTLACSGTIVYVPPHVKLNPQKLTQVFQKYGISILQCTPSFFMRFEKKELKTLLSVGSPLRVLALGGEPFVDKEHLRSIISEKKEMSMLIFNLYGTTELSCWSSMTQISLDDHSDPAHITTLLTDSGFQFERDFEGEVSLSTTTRSRRCVVLRESDGAVIEPKLEENKYIRSTGDLVEVNREHNPTYVRYKGRNDKTIKRFGHLVDLNDVEERTMATGLVGLAATFSHMGKIYLIVQFKEDVNATPSKLVSMLRKYLNYRSYPDHVLVVSQIPLTINGKVDVKQIKGIVLKKIEVQKIDLPCVTYFPCKYDEGDVRNMLESKWRTHTRAKTPPEGNFFEAGGNSFHALHYVEEIFQELSLFGTSLQQEASPEILNILMRKVYPEFVSYILNHVCRASFLSIGISTVDPLLNEELTAEILQGGDSTSTGSVDSNAGHLPAMLTNSEFNIPITTSRHWKFNLYGCVDATPVVVQSKDGPLVVSASNSGVVIVANLLKLSTLSSQNATDAVLWSRKLPDRIVCSPAVQPGNGYIAIACCDQNLYVFNVMTGSLKWIRKCRTMLRSAPVFNVDGSICFLAADSNVLLKLDFEDGSALDEMFVKNTIGCITPLLLSAGSGNSKLQHDLLFVATYGSIKKIQTHPCLKEENDIKIDSNQTPAIRIQLATVDIIVFGRSTGELEACIFNQPGYEFAKAWRIEMDEKLASPLNTPTSYAVSDQLHIVICTTQIGKFYIVNAEEGEILASCKLNEHTKSNPIIITASQDYLIVAVNLTRGGLTFIKVQLPATPDLNVSLEVVGTLDEAPGVECFSSVAVYGKTIMFGSRDDHLHVLELKGFN